MMLTKSGIKSCSWLPIDHHRHGLIKKIINRCLASKAGVGLAPGKPFDREAKVLQRNRSVEPLLELNADNDMNTTAWEEDGQQLKREIAFRMADRLYDLEKKPIDVCVELGAGTGHLLWRNLSSSIVSRYIYADSSHTTLKAMSQLLKLSPERRGCDEDEDDTQQGLVTPELVLIDEENLPFKPESVDVFTSSLALHWINNLPLFLMNIFLSLKMNGCFMASFLGGGSGTTLGELRSSLQLAEMERSGGFSPTRISPQISPQDIGGLLNSVGFSLITLDCDVFTIRYPSATHLMYDLKSMGESNALTDRVGYLSRDSLLATNAVYHSLYGSEKPSSEVPDDQKGVPATFQVFYLIGWKEPKK